MILQSTYKSTKIRKERRKHHKKCGKDHKKEEKNIPASAAGLVSQQPPASHPSSLHRVQL